MSPAPTSLDGLVQLAESLAEGSRPLPGVSTARAACWVARQALELLIDQFLRHRNLEPGRSTTRTRLIALGIAYGGDPDLSYRASTSYWRLSAACHHHAFELGPTQAEAVSLVAQVRSLRARMDDNE